MGRKKFFIKSAFKRGTAFNDSLCVRCGHSASSYDKHCEKCGGKIETRVRDYFARCAKCNKLFAGLRMELNGDVVSYTISSTHCSGCGARIRS